MSEVWIIRSGEDLRKAVRDCYEQALEPHLDGVGQVLLKPNFVVGLPSDAGVTTDLRILAELLALLRNRGLRARVGESSLHSTERVLRELGVDEMGELAGSVVNFDREGWTKVKCPDAAVLREFHLPRVVVESDLVISVGKMKTHSLTTVTLSVKNLFGMLPRGDRKLAHSEGLDEAIVDLFEHVKRRTKVFSMVDGVYALDGRNGPTSGRAVRMGLLVAGVDPLSVDATCARVMGCDPNAVRHLALCRDRGLGEMGAITIRGAKLADVRRGFDLPPSGGQILPSLFHAILERVFKKTPYLKSEDKCTRCGCCADICPKNCIDIQSGAPTVSERACISCLCCCEACKYGAMDYRVRNYPLYRTLKWLRNVVLRKGGST